MHHSVPDGHYRHICGTAMEKDDAKPWERPWTTDEIREHSVNWNLAGDSGLLNHLQQFSQNLLTRTHATEVALDKLVEDLKTTATTVQNATNTFLFLANTQFVENRVYDDDEKETPPEEKKDDVKLPKTKEEQEAEVFQNVKKALDMGLALLDTHFEAVEVPASDSEEEESSASVGRLVLKPKNPYISRPLPYLIGSREFMEDDKVGLGDISSDTEDSPDQNIVQSSESDDEMEHDELTVTPKRPMALTSSDLENSEPESDRSEIVSKQKKLKTVGVFGEEIEERDMFRQESPPESDGVSIVKGGMKSAFSDELSSKLGVVKSQNVSDRENVKDNIFVPSSEPEDDGLFSKENHTFTDKQGLFDDLEDWQSTSDSLWKNDNISSSKPNASKGHPTKEADVPSGVSENFGAHDQEDEVFTITKMKASAPTNISQKEKISASTPQDVTPPKPKVDSLFGLTDETEDLFSQNYKDIGPPAGKPALFGKDNIEDDDLFAIPSSSDSTQPGPSQNLNKKKKLPGAVPVFSGVNLFGDLSPIVQRGSISESTEGNSHPSGSGLQFQESSSGIGSSVDEFKKDGESRSQECAVTSNESSSILDSQKMFQNAVTSTKIADAFPRKSSLFNTEIDSDSLFDKPRSADQRNLSGSKIPASTSSSFKSKTKKTVSLFDDSDSGDDELLFSSTSSTSSRSRRSQGSGDVLGSGIERKTLPKKDLFDDNLLFGNLNKDEPEVDIFGSQTESRSRPFAKDNAGSGIDVVSDKLTDSKKVMSSIFDDIDEVDDIFSVPKTGLVETQKQVVDQSQVNLGKLSLFSDNLGDTNDIFSNETNENKKEDGIVPVSEVPEVPSHCDKVVSSISDNISVGTSDITSSLLPKDSSQIFGLENKSSPESQEPLTVKTVKPSISRKPNVPKKSAPSSVLSQNNLNLGSKVEENNTSVSDTRTKNVEKLSNVETNDHDCDLSSDVFVEQVSDDQTHVSSVIKPDPPRTLNIRKTTEIVFGSPSNEDDDLFESAQADKLIAGKDSILSEKFGTETLSSNNFSKLLEDFNSSSVNIASTGSVSREESSNDSETSSKNADSSDVLDIKGPQKSISSPIKLLIDPRTLLPVARPPNKMVSSEGTIGFDKPAETSTLHSAGKERVKIQVKRRPQTRRARQEALRASSIEYDNIDAALTSQVSNSKNDNVQNNIISSSASSSSPVNNATLKVFEPDGIRNSPVVEKNSSLSEKDPELNSEGQSLVSESNQLPIKTDAFKSMLSDCLSGNSNALSPLTDEEDLFAVPHELPFDESNNKEIPNNSKNLFDGAPVLSPMDDKTDSENFSQSSFKMEGGQDIQTDLEDTLNNKHMFEGDTLVSDISSTVVCDKNSNKTPPSIINTEEGFVNNSDSKWLGYDLERSTENRGLFDDDGGDEVESDDDDDNDLFSSIQKQSKSRNKAKKNTSEVTSQRPLFSPEVSLENTSKENVERKKSFSEEFHKSLIQEVLNVSSQPTTSKNVSRSDKMVTDENPSFLPVMASESSKQNENDLFAENENPKEIKIVSSVKTSEKNVSHGKVKSHVASLFGDDSIESDDLFGSSVPKMSVSGPKSKNTKESLFDDGDDDDDIFTLSLNKSKGPKSEALFSKDDGSLLCTEKDDDLFSKKTSGSKNQVSKPSAAQKVQSFEDPLTLFNK